MIAPANTFRILLRTYNPPSDRVLDLVRYCASAHALCRRLWAAKSCIQKDACRGGMITAVFERCSASSLWHNTHRTRLTKSHPRDEDLRFLFPRRDWGSWALHMLTPARLSIGFPLADLVLPSPYRTTVSQSLQVSGPLLRRWHRLTQQELAASKATTNALNLVFLVPPIAHQKIGVSCAAWRSVSHTEKPSASNNKSWDKSRAA